ncbi:hypothetical protein PSE_4985 [Pseudovibrio sp. FO-BEG1]|nr:hypothetical protein PSE_4985 [Pseudovibrio sp. FO-BEG1]
MVIGNGLLMNAESGMHAAMGCCVPESFVVVEHVGQMR